MYLYWTRTPIVFRYRKNFDQVHKLDLIDQVASNKSSSLLKIILLNTQTLQVFTKIIKTESIHKSY